MEVKKIITRDGEVTDELYRDVEKTYKDILVKYKESYYLDYAVDENSGKVDKTKKEIFYTKDQVDKNIRSKKNAYMVEMGSVSPEEIKQFRGRYHIPASILSVVLGFSKNTISIIETEGISNLTTGRFIKVCMSNINIIHDYINICNAIDDSKKEELRNRIRGIA